MKRFFAVLLALCMLCASAALADTATARLNQRIATRTGPGTEYFEPGSFLTSGHYVTVHTKVWDDRNEIWWVQVEFTASGDSYRAYTGSWRMNVDLSDVPEEQPLRSCYLLYDADVFAGPGWDYVMWNDTVYAGTSAILMEVENGYGLIECWNDQKNMPWRVWADLDDLSCGWYYDDWEDTYPDDGDYDYDYDDDYDYDYGYDDDYDYDYGSSYPVGQWCTITGGIVNCRNGAGTSYETIKYVYKGERYQVLGCRAASDGQDWYQIRVDGVNLWIYSGLTSLGSSGSNNSSPSYGAFPIGEWCRITTSSGHARSGPGQEYTHITYVNEGEYYVILDTGTASNGRMWYQIEVDGRYCWISSGIASVNGVIY